MLRRGLPTAERFSSIFQELRICGFRFYAALLSNICRYRRIKRHGERLSSPRRKRIGQLRMSEEVRESLRGAATLQWVTQG